MGYSRKKTKQGGGVVGDILFWTAPGIFHFFTLPLEISEKTKLHPWKFHKIVWHPLEIPRPKTKTTGNSSLFFLGHPWKFHFVLTPGNSTCYFFDTLENSISSAPLPCFFFFWNSPWTILEKKTNSGLRICSFLGYWRNNKWNFQWLITNNVGFPGVIKKKSCGISRGLGFRPENSAWCRNTILWSF